jgi:hypothetical protein
MRCEKQLTPIRELANQTRDKSKTEDSMLHQVNWLRAISASAALLMTFSIEAQQNAASTSNGITPAAITTLSGGAVKSIQKVTQNSPTFITSHTYVDLPGANRFIFTPAGTDLINVTFTGECRLINGLPPNEWVEVRVLVDNVPMQPNDVSSPTAFCSANGYAMHAAIWGRRVAGPAFHFVRFQWRVSAGGLKQAWLDDWTFEVAVSE